MVSKPRGRGPSRGGAVRDSIRFLTAHSVDECRRIRYCLFTVHWSDPPRSHALADAAAMPTFVSRFPTSPDGCERQPARRLLPVGRRGRTQDECSTTRRWTLRSWRIPPSDRIGNRQHCRPRVRRRSRSSSRWRPHHITVHARDAGLGDRRWRASSMARLVARGNHLDLLPNEADRIQLEADMPRVPRSFYDHDVDVPPGWSQGGCGYLMLSDAYEAELQDAGERGWPTARFDSTTSHLIPSPKPSSRGPPARPPDRLSRSEHHRPSADQSTLYRHVLGRVPRALGSVIIGRLHRVEGVRHSGR